jgi:lipopolysaccharide export system protein LptA
VIFIYTMYTGQIYYKGEPITVEQAVDLKLITVDSNGDIWLYNDASHLIKITGDLNLG